MPQTRPRATGGGLPQFITHNFALKLIALGLSLMLFSLVHSDVDAQRTIYLDVVALLPPPASGKMLVSPLPAQVKVTMRGSRSKLSSLSRDELAPLQMDLRDGSARSYHFDAHQLDTGGNVRVMEITPPSVTLTWAAASEKRVPVHVQLDGELERGLALQGDVETEPGYVTLRGPAPTLAAITTVSTEPVSLIDLGLGSHRRRLPLESAPEYVSYVEDSSVEVRLVVRPIVAERAFKRLEIAAVGDAQVALRPERVEVILRGPQDVLAGVEPDGLLPYVEVAPGTSGVTQLREIKLRGVPDGVEVMRILPPSSLVRWKGKR